MERLGASPTLQLRLLLLIDLVIQLLRVLLCVCSHLLSPVRPDLSFREQAHGIDPIIIFFLESESSDELRICVCPSCDFDICLGFNGELGKAAFTVKPPPDECVGLAEQIDEHESQLVRGRSVRDSRKDEE